LYPDIPKDENPPFPSAWIYSRHTQDALLKKFFDPIKDEQSLLFSISKEQTQWMKTAED
jgi:hypothetical protein